jgi:hypothetical protein
LLGRNWLRIWPVLALLAAVLGGCGSDSGSGFAFGKTVTPPPLDPKLFPAQYKTQIAEFMRTYLTNPSRVKDAFIGQPVLKTIGGTEQYITCVRYNPRIRENQYSGSETKLVIFLGGRLNQVLAGTPEMCAGLTYQRFTELETLVP